MGKSGVLVELLHLCYTFEIKKCHKSLICSTFAFGIMYPDPGSNRDGLPHWCLRPARLPIPPSGLCDCKGTNNIFISQVKCEKSLSSIFFCLSIFASSREVLFPSATDCWLISSSSVTTSEIFQPYLFLTPYYNSSIRLCAIP